MNKTAEITERVALSSPYIMSCSFQKLNIQRNKNGSKTVLPTHNYNPTVNINIH